MNIEIIQVPYDSGYLDTRTGMGPIHFIKNGLAAFLESRGHTVAIRTVASDVPLPTEIGTTIDVNRNLAKTVCAAVRKDRFPLVLAGNCNSCVGAIAGLGAQRLGVIWLDAHGDFNTPETTTTGFLDGMGLAMATGRCWAALLNTIPGFSPVAENNIVHLGSRDLDPAEKQMLRDANIPVLVPDPSDKNEILVSLSGALSRLKNCVEGIYLHIDLDVLETEYGQPNHLAVAGGLPPGTVVDAIAIIKRQLKILGCTIASYDPDYDENDNVLNAGMAVASAIVDN